MYDLIGDIHGHADELIQLLEILEYRKLRGIYRHPERKVVFLGDFIDRGDQIRQVLEIVRPMVEAEAAYSVIGNHEWNALAFHTENPAARGEFLRIHSPKNVTQIRKTLEQLPPPEFQSYLNWFRTLPLWLELEGLHVVHACWDDRAVANIDRRFPRHRGITDEFLVAAGLEGNELFQEVEIVLKGKEAMLPDGIRFQDKDGTVRSKMRTRWYESPVGQTYQSYAFETSPIDCSRDLEPDVLDEAEPYPASAVPVFIGHYWLSAKHPAILANNVACLDYSVAKNGFLCAYRWQGERSLCDDCFSWVASSSRP